MWLFWNCAIKPPFRPDPLPDTQISPRPNIAGWRKIQGWPENCTFLHCNNFVYFQPISIIFAHIRLRLRSSRVVDTLGHTSTPIFSVGCRFFSLFPGHTNGLQSWHMVSIQFFSRSSWFALDVVVHLPIHGLLRYSIVVHAIAHIHYRKFVTGGSIVNLAHLARFV